MKEWFDLPETRRIAIFETASNIKGVPVESIEKDWWVTITLKAVFELPVAKHLVFKGGTSLSKAWGVIQRFSEDIDLALSRDFLGFSGIYRISSFLAMTNCVEILKCNVKIAF